MFEPRVYLGVRYIWRDDPRASLTYQLAPESLGRTCADFVRSELGWYKMCAHLLMVQLVGREQRSTHDLTECLRRRQLFVNENRAAVSCNVFCGEGAA
jgi:hypothetical protein